MKYIRKFNESIDIYNIDWKSIVPKSLSVIKDNRTTSFTIGNIMKNFDMIQITYDTTGGEIWGYPDTLEFDLYFAKPIKDENTPSFKIDVDVTLGDLMVSEFSISPPNIIDVIQYTSYHSKFDPSNTVFAFTDESLLEIIKFFNLFTDIHIERNNLNFLDDKVDSYIPE